MLKLTKFKNRGKNAFYRNWKNCIIICFIYAVFAGHTVIKIYNNIDININNINILILFIASFIILLYLIFISKVLEVGLARFFLENKKFSKTKVNRLIMPYKLSKTTHIAYTMFKKNLFIILWLPTIIGALIKYYSYILVPYILAENPNIKSSDALNLSQDIMKGYKFEMFKLDISFIFWKLLGYLTFNIGNLVFTNPYMFATKAEAYLFLKDLAKTKGIKNAELLNDYYLEGNIIESEYPLYDYMLKDIKKNLWLNINYKRNYSLLNLILIFFIFSCIGWIWEVILHFLNHLTFVNRGTLYGPWLPIYGAGCLALLVFLKKYRKNPFIYFLLAMLISGIIEYGTSIYLELVHNMAWWDYTDYFLNLNGRICLEGLLLFGISGTIATYIISPLIANFLDKIKKNYKIIICIFLLLIISIDFYISTNNPNTGQGITTNIKK